MAKSKILPHELELITQLAVEGLIKGYSNSELLSIIQQSYSHVPIEDVEKKIREATSLIKERTLTDIDKIIPQHIELYEKVYRECDNIRYVPGKIKAMRGKEKLIGLHREQNHIEVINEIDIEIEQGSSDYDLSKLNAQELKRLEELMKMVVRS